jgi:molybdenum cofactor cytidylyltransferase
MSESIGVIVLAAGQGSRFRQVAGEDKDKLLADCMGRDGAVRSVIEHVLW